MVRGTEDHGIADDHACMHTPPSFLCVHQQLFRLTYFNILDCQWCLHGYRPRGEGAAWQSNLLKKRHILIRLGATVGYRTQFPYIVAAAGHRQPVCDNGNVC